MWVLDGFYCPYGRSIGPLWAEIYERAHMEHKWVKYGLKYMVPGILVSHVVLIIGGGTIEALRRVPHLNLAP